jgi:Cu-Zn family superoxide dismutase
MRYFVPAVVLLAACHGKTAKTAPQPVTNASFTLMTPDGRQVGEGALQQTPTGVLLTASLTGLPAGTHGMHFHSVAQCTGPDFSSAGPHHNPTNKMHGSRNPAGPHAGDLANINIPEGGTVRIEQLAPNVQLGPGAGTLFDADGASIVIHALADDYQTDPSGASGSRIACGVIRR